MTKLHQLHELGQSTWLNYMRRAFIQSGGLRERIADGIQGVTANAVVFEETISNYDDYDDHIRREVRAGTPLTRIQEALMIDDVQRAADFLHPIYESSDGLDGFASLELDPTLTDETVCAVATARRMLARIDRGNVMVEVPATRHGINAFETLTADGVSINLTHIFSVSVFERAAQAYIAGLETYFESHSVWRTAPTAVASFSLAPIDGAVDEKLAAMDRPDLMGKAGIAMAHRLYARFQQIFSGPRWQRLSDHGARVLRPKWTRIKPFDARYDDTFYANELIGPHTVITFTPPTLDAFLDHGSTAQTVGENLVDTMVNLLEIEKLGIDLETLMEEVQQAHLDASDKQYQSLIQSVIRKLYVELPGGGT
jgi:transaldolase/glucose-6-phosphate isomerase